MVQQKETKAWICPCDCRTADAVMLQMQDIPRGRARCSCRMCAWQAVIAGRPEPCGFLAREGQQLCEKCEGCLTQGPGTHPPLTVPAGLVGHWGAWWSSRGGLIRCDTTCQQLRNMTGEAVNSRSRGSSRSSWLAQLILLALAMAVSLGTDFLRSLHDVSVDFYHTMLDTEIHVVPLRGEEEDDLVWQLGRALDGTRSASFLFQQFAMDTMKAAGFMRTDVACQVFWHQECGDFLAISHRLDADADWLDIVLNENMMIERGSRARPPQYGGSASESFLKRTSACAPEGFRWQHDTTHVDTFEKACLGDKRPLERNIPSSSEHADRRVPAPCGDYVALGL